MAPHADLRRALRDFGEPAVSRTSFAAAPAPVPADLPTLSAAEAEALAASRAEQACAALRAEMEDTHRREIASLRDAHERETAGLLAACGEASAERILSAFAALEEALRLEVPDRVARLLAPMLSEVQARRAGDALALAIAKSLADPAGVRLAARGPRALWDTLAPRLAAAGLACDWREADGLELTVTHGETLWRTRLGEWFEGVEAALAPDPSGEGSPA